MAKEEIFILNSFATKKEAEQFINDNSLTIVDAPEVWRTIEPKKPSRTKTNAKIDCEEFSVAFQISYGRIFEVRYIDLMKEGEKSFHTSTRHYVKTKNGIGSSHIPGTLQERYNYNDFSEDKSYIAKRFLEKWVLFEGWNEIENKIEDFTTIEEYAEMRKDLGKLKETYNYIEGKKTDLNKSKNGYSISDEKLQALSFMDTK